jgi:urease accessory protein
MSWQANLNIRYHQNSQNKILAQYTHNGPLRILQNLYPEGDAICHNVLIHPPGGIVGGDTLSIDLRLEPHTHSLMVQAKRLYWKCCAKACVTNTI